MDLKMVSYGPIPFFTLEKSVNGMMNCRFCKAPLNKVFIDLGASPPANSFLSKEELPLPEPNYPLKLYVCEQCFLVQIDEYKSAEDIFSNEYVYFSSFSKSWLQHAKNYVEQMQKRFSFGSTSLVMEIASNDGYLLQYFKEAGVPVLGIEPTANTAAEAEKKGITSVTEFFGTELAQKLAGQGRSADLLIGNNVLAHVPDINDFVKGMKIILKPGGAITMEFPHLMQLMRHNQFDTIYHEHFSYLSFTTVKKIFNAQGLELFDVEELPTHGGSLRIYAKHAGNNAQAVMKSVADLLAKEEKEGMKDVEHYNGFQEKADKIKTDLLGFLSEAKAANKKVCAYGAAAKGNTLLNYCGVKSDLVEFVVDASPHKQGKYLPGSHIPVVAEQFIRDSKPDFLLILPWNIKDEIIAQLEYARNWNGKFVIPIPKIEVIA
jgi:hypothetical protein